MNQSRSLPLKTNGPRTSGFSLIELLVAMLILGVGMLGLAALMTSNLRAGSGARQRDAAALLANDVLERLSADGRLSAILRNNGTTTFSTSNLVASATDDAVNVFQEADASGTLQATFDLEGRPSATTPIFTVNWARRAPKAGSPTPVASSGSVTAEVVANVTWTETGQGTSVIQKWLSCSRIIRY